MRCTERSEVPLAAAMVRPVQCFASPGGGSPGFRVLSRSKPATPSRMNRCCQRHAQRFDTPARRKISAVPYPSAVDRMIRARQAYFCGLLRSATTY